MQYACKLRSADGLDKPTGGVVCDDETRRLCYGQIEFEALGEVKVKGKEHPVKIFHPYPRKRATIHPPMAPALAMGIVWGVGLVSTVGVFFYRQWKFPIARV